MKGLAGALWRRAKAWASSLACGGAANGLSVAARLDLGSKRSLLVVAYGGRRFLVGGGGDAVSAIVEIEAGRPRAAGAASLAARRRRARARELGGRSASAPGAAPARGGLRLEMSRGKN